MSRTRPLSGLGRTARRCGRVWLPYPCGAEREREDLCAVMVRGTSYAVPSRLCRRAVVLVVVWVMVGGCSSRSEREWDVSESEASRLETQIRATFDRARDAAMSETGGSESRRGQRVSLSRCNDFADERLVQLKVGGTFVVRRGTVDEVASGLEKAWHDIGLKIDEAFDGYELEVETERSGVDRLAGLAQIAATRDEVGRSIVGVAIGFRTGCVRLPNNLARSDWPGAAREGGSRPAGSGH